MHAVNFYKKLNFQIIKKTPLIKIIKEDEIKYENAKENNKKKIEKYYLNMRYQKFFLKEI